MGSFSIWHWLIVLVIVVLVFGTKKLKGMGADLGGAVKGFKDGIKTGGEEAKDAAAAATNATSAQVSDASTAAKTTIDVEAKHKS